MNDSLPVSTGRTKKYQIPYTHLEHQYIYQCTDGLELEQIYKELIDGQEGSHETLAQFTLDRIRNIYPNSLLLRSNPTQTDRSIVVNSHSIPSTSVITNTHNGLESINHDEWKKFGKTVSNEFDSDEEDEEESSIKNESHDFNKRLHLAERHRLNADAALIQNNYQQSIDLYTKSIQFEPNILAYIKRAAAYFKLDNFDASIKDYSHVLSRDSENITALTGRARCYIAKNYYDQAKQDLNLVLSIDAGNVEIEDLMNTVIAIQTSDMESTDISHTDQDHGNRLITIDIPPRNSSPFESDQQNIDQYHTSSSHIDDDDMELGDEAGDPDIRNHGSDDEERTSGNYNVSPTIDEGLENQAPTMQPSFSNSIDQCIAIELSDNYQRTNQFSTITNQTIDENDELYDNSTNNYQTYSSNSSTYDIIANSNFGSIIQNWLRDFVKHQSAHRYINRPWSRSPRPYSLDRIQSDIDRHNRFDEYRNAIDVSKKMLQNGVLDYHYHADYLVDTLSDCAKCYLKIYDYSHAIQYATEALQYNKNSSDTLMYRAKAFENQKFFLFSYADYMRVPRNDYNYSLARHACEKLAFELKSTEGENWRDKIPNNQNDHEPYFNYLKLTNDYSEENSYEWYRRHADQLYHDACYVLAIWFYTMSIEIRSDMKECYLKRAACYLKVFESQKAICDCEMILKDDEKNFLALYYKALALKIALDHHGYELTLKECVKLQPKNQIILAEYYSCQRKQIPRKNRRIRMKSIDDIQLSYDELEQIRLDNIYENASIDSCDIREQCSFIFHTKSFDTLTITLFKMIINISRIIIRSEETYHREHRSEFLSFSYIKYMLDILIQLTELPNIDSILSNLEDKYRILLNELIEYYSTKFHDLDKLNHLKRL